MAKKQLDVEEAKPKRNTRNSRQRGIRYEQAICKELRELGFSAITTRFASKMMDDSKVDIIDENGELPLLQLKRQQNYPNYIAIRDSCPIKDKEFVILWNQQKGTEKTFRSVGEMAIMSKAFFYELIKHYYGKV